MITASKVNEEVRQVVSMKRKSGPVSTPMGQLYALPPYDLMVDPLMNRRALQELPE